MKKILISTAVAAIAILGFAAKKAADPVLMTVNGKPVHKSEFEYLYHKNNTQQLNPQSVDEYLSMFIDYKLKVAAAEAAGLDTTPSFVSEFDNYRQELAAPYMTDTAVANQLLREAYAHTLEDVNVSHIMLGQPTTPAEQKKTREMLDSLRNVLVNGTAEDWNAAAAKYSIDRGTSQNGGKMNWLVPGRFPWPFEEMAYKTPVGQISPIVDSGYGYHIILVNDRRPSLGQVRVAHILKLTVRKSEEEAARAKQQIDSLYKVVTAPGADFGAVAKAESEDPGSAPNNGFIDWFGSGMMVAEFDSVAFALPEGEISKPVKTAYGYHIVKNLGHRAPLPLDSVKATLQGQINNDERSQRPARVYLDRVIANYKGHILDAGLDRIEKQLADGAGYDSLAREALKVSDIPVFEINGKKYPVSGVMPYVNTTASKDPKNARRLIESAARQSLETEAYNLERQNLYETNPDYRNVVNEYRDGILLFDISNSRVWEAASKDKAGLEKYFKAHKNDYRWEKPKYKGFIVFATSDSLLNIAKDFVNSLGDSFNKDTFADLMSKRFDRSVKVERIIAAQGDNPISDYLFFNGPKPEGKNLTWKYYFGFGGHLAQQPEEAIDVRGQVTTDYQNALEREWVQELRKKYPVKINKKVAATLN